MSISRRNDQNDQAIMLDSDKRPPQSRKLLSSIPPGQEPRKFELGYQKREAQKRSNNSILIHLNYFSIFFFFELLRWEVHDRLRDVKRSKSSENNEETMKSENNGEPRLSRTDQDAVHNEKSMKVRIRKNEDPKPELTEILYDTVIPTTVCNV